MCPMICSTYDPSRFRTWREPVNPADVIDLEDSSDEEQEEDEDSAEYGGKMLFDLLVGLLINGALSAHRVCLIAWWASQAGAVGVQDLRFRPGAPTGHYQRKLDRALGLHERRRERVLVKLRNYENIPFLGGLSRPQ